MGAGGGGMSLLPQPQGAQGAPRLHLHLLPAPPSRPAGSLQHHRPGSAKPGSTCCWFPGCTCWQVGLQGLYRPTGQITQRHSPSLLPVPGSLSSPESQDGQELCREPGAAPPGQGPRLPRTCSAEACGPSRPLCPALLRPVRAPLFPPLTGLIGPSSSNLLSPGSSSCSWDLPSWALPPHVCFCIFSPHGPPRHDTPQHPLHPVTHVCIQNVGP